jgi:hypothetical protein
MALGRRQQMSDGLFRITITKVTKGRTRKGVPPEPKEEVVYSQAIKESWVPRIVRAVNAEAVEETSLFPKE